MILSGTNINTYLDHTTSDPLVQFYMRNGGKQKLLSLPVCPKCERTGLRSKGWIEHKIMTCPHCGFNGKATHQLSTYIKEGLYR